MNPLYLSLKLGPKSFVSKKRQDKGFVKFDEISPSLFLFLSPSLFLSLLVYPSHFLPLRYYFPASKIKTSKNFVVILTLIRFCCERRWRKQEPTSSIFFYIPFSPLFNFSLFFTPLPLQLLSFLFHSHPKSF